MSPTFSPWNWEQRRCVSGRTKLMALASMIVVDGLSVGPAPETLIAHSAGGALILPGMVTVLALRTCRPAKPAVAPVSKD